MAKDTQMSIKMEPELRDQFMAVAASRHRPAAQIVRELMRFYIAQNETPNTLTAETIAKARRGEDVFSAKDAEDLFRQLGI
jgi:predicted DNA-binding protein